MYPGFIPHWKRQYLRDVYAIRHCGGGEERAREPRYEMSGEDPMEFGFFGAASLRVRRPLRFLTYKLELQENQVAELAKILDEIKTERAQVAVDHRRALSAFADAIEADVFDEARAASGAQIRVQSAERLKGAVLNALSRLHRMLDPQQRTRLAYLIRTGTLSI
jgi:hypothetical protein